VVANVVQQAVDDVLRARSYSRRSGSWYRTQRETVAVINLQRSNFSSAYYLNIALWFSALGADLYPKEHHCHVRTRIDRIVADARTVALALDPESAVEADQRTRVISDALTVADDLLTACSTLEGCRTPYGRQLIDRSLVRANAIALLHA
jgi:hypothetical protein